MPIPARAAAASDKAPDTDVVAIDQGRRASSSAVWPLLAGAAMVVGAVGWVASRDAAPAQRAAAGLVQAMPELAAAGERHAAPADSAPDDSAPADGAPADGARATEEPAASASDATPPPARPGARPAGRPAAASPTPPVPKPAAQPQTKPGSNEFGI
jgi:hypothetical protein